MLAKIVANILHFLENRKVKKENVQNRPHLRPPRKSLAVISGNFELLVFQLSPVLRLCLKYIDQCIPGLQAHISLSYIRAENERLPIRTISELAYCNSWEAHIYLNKRIKNARFAGLSILFWTVKHERHTKLPKALRKYLRLCQYRKGKCPATLQRPRSDRGREMRSTYAQGGRGCAPK